MKTYTDEWMTASGNAAYVSGLIIGMLKHSNMVEKDINKKFLLKQLIEIHSESPISNSENLIKECEELLKTIQ